MNAERRREVEEEGAGRGGERGREGARHEVCTIQGGAGGTRWWGWSGTLRARGGSAAIACWL